MAPTLQDVVMLLGLSITGDAVGPRVVPSTWLEDLVQRFAGVATTIDLEDFNEHPQSKGPSNHVSYSSRYNFLQNDVLMHFIALKYLMCFLFSMFVLHCSRICWQPMLMSTA